jgi:hypothetical protein
MNSTRAIISEILQIPDCESWSITDSIEDKGLYNVHYSQDADKTKYGSLRGIVVDIKTKCIVCCSYGYTPTFVSDDINVPQIMANNAALRIGYEGTIIRVFKHQGIVYTSTHRRIIPNQSRWGNSKPFAEIYRNAGGPTDELFNNEPNSKFVHVMLITDPELLSASVADINQSHVFYLETFKMEGPAGNDWADEQPESANKVILFNPKIFVVQPIDIEFAQYHLTYGFSDPKNKLNKDPRFRNGEFVIAVSRDGNVSRINSVAFEHRVKLRQADPNFYHNYVQLLQYALHGNENYPTKDALVAKARANRIVEFNDMFSPICNSDQECREAVEYLKANPVKIIEEFYNPYHTTIFLNFWMTLPPYARQEALTYYNRYYNDCRKVVDFLMLYHKDKKIHVGRDVKSVVDDIERNVNPSNVEAEIKKQLGKRLKYMIYPLISEMNKYAKRVAHMQKKNAQSSTSSDNTQSTSSIPHATVYEYIQQSQEQNK